MRSEKEQLGDNSRRRHAHVRPKYPVQFLHGEDVYLVPNLASFLLWNSVDTSRLWNSPRSAPATSTLRLATAGQPFLPCLLSPFSLLLPRFFFFSSSSSCLPCMRYTPLSPIFAHHWFSSPLLPSSWLKVIFDKVNVSTAGECKFSNIDRLILFAW